MNELILAEELTLDQHVEKIRECLEKTRDAIFETAMAIKDCHDQLGVSVVQGDVADRLGMSRPTLNRWLSIGNSEFISLHQKSLPTTFSSLYDLTQVEKKYHELHPRSASTKLQDLIEKGTVNLASVQKDIKDILKRVDDQIRKKQKQVRQQKIVKWGGSTYSSNSRITTLDDLLQKKELFKTIVVDLQKKEKISKWGDDGFFETDIADEFPLYEVRSPSLTESVICLLKCPMKKINVGIKVLSAFGFAYRDTFVPQQKATGALLNMSTETVVIRGERGLSKNTMNLSIASSSTNDLLLYCEKNFSKPLLAVFFEDLDRDGWVCINE